MASAENGEAATGSSSLPGKEQRVESLGWLTESSVMPKKKRAIEGVGAASIVELRAELYRSQEDAKRMKEGDPDAVLHRSSLKKVDVFSKKNSGVQDRANRDKLQLKAETDGSASYAALEKKAILYEKLVRGELPDEEDREKYSVDFLRKGLLEDEINELVGNEPNEGISVSEDRLEAGVSRNLGVDGMPGNDRHSGIGWSSGRATVIGQEHKVLVRQVNEETIEAREKAAILKQRRELQAQKNREKLKQAFIKKKLEKLKAAQEKHADLGQQH